MSRIKVQFLGVPILTGQVIQKKLKAEAVEEAENADLIVTTPAELEEMLEDAAATAAYHATRDQERVPAETVHRLVAGENPVKVWREYRGLSQRSLAECVGLNFAYLSQIETGARKGPVKTMKRLAEALGVDLGDLT